MKKKLLLLPLALLPFTLLTSCSNDNKILASGHWTYKDNKDDRLVIYVDNDNPHTYYTDNQYVELDYTIYSDKAYVKYKTKDYEYNIEYYGNISWCVSTSRDKTL